MGLNHVSAKARQFVAFALRGSLKTMEDTKVKKFFPLCMLCFFLLSGALSAGAAGGAALTEELPLQVCKLLKEKNWAGLADIVHPSRGLTFSPYSYIDEDAVRFTPEQVRGLSREPEKKYTWGAFDGSGEPMELTFGDYYARFIFDKDFSKAPCALNKIVRTSNSEENLNGNRVELFGAEAAFAEFYLPGKDEMDWGSLRLVFVMENGQWRLVAISHDGWTV